MSFVIWKNFLYLALVEKRIRNGLVLTKSIQSLSHANKIFTDIDIIFGVFNYLSHNLLLYSIIHT